MKNYNNFDAIAKEHKKLYKSGKTWIAATLMTVGLAGGAMLSGTTTANADEVTPVQSAGTIQTNQKATDTELANAQSDAQKQQSTIDSANTQLKDQQNQLSEAQGQQSSAQQELDQAKQAQQAATQNDPAVKQAQADVKQAQQQVDNQQQVVNDAQTVVNDDAKNVQSTSDAATQASQAVDQARQTATDAINQAAAQQANEAQSKIDQLENQGKAQASQNLDNQINNVSGQVTDAQNDVNNTNSKISDLQGQVKDLQGKQDNTQNFDGFHYPKDAGEPGAMTDLTNYDNQYKYVSNPADEQVKIDDYANLSPEIQKQLTIYAAQLVNSFGRELRNMVPDVVNAKGGAFEPLMINDASLDEAKYAAQLYDQDNWSINQHGNTHDTKALEAAAIKYGAYATEMDGTKDPAVNESATGQILATDNRSTTLDKLKNAIFNAINNMLYDDADNGNTHMMSLAQVWHLPDDWHFGHDWVGLAFDKLGQLHIVFAENNAYAINYNGPIYKATNYNYSPYLTASNESVDHAAEINNLNSQISDLKNVLLNQQAHLTDLQNQLQNLQAQKANTQFELNQLTPAQQTEYTNARNTLNTIKNWKNKQLAHIDDNSNVQDALKKLASANNDLVSAKQIQTEDETKLQQAKDSLASLNQILVAKKSTLDIAEQSTNTQAVKNAQNKLDTINSKINDLQTAIKTTQVTISNAQIQLDKDNQKIADIKNGQNLVKPDTNKDEGNRNVATPTDNKSSETTNPAQPDTDNALISGQAGYKHVTLNNGKEVANTVTKPTIVLPTTDKENDSAVSGAQGQNITMTREQYKAQQAKLPQTGNNDSKAVIALGVLAGMFGFGLVTKGKKEF
ncbi:SEC10/PgrA surface exclusion domain-containing protein [Limosilactobacillus reuteri]|uniref:SEC10/PgrA surface exclusion domain-containing protein n=1 Tax=Limosilactobacillus reuteri TaxID=1598 RepID=UPI00177E9174|nr:SEC10/PgrA surface exclusion domain-containing protein [Limosilactobacillus reuteri]